MINNPAKKYLKFIQYFRILNELSWPFYSDIKWLVHFNHIYFLVIKCLKSLGCHCMRLRQFSHSKCFISQQHPRVDRPWYILANLMSMCFLLLARSTIRLFQTSCSFHVYKQRVEIKKERKKIWGNQTSCIADTTCSRPGTEKMCRFFGFFLLIKLIENLWYYIRPDNKMHPFLSSWLDVLSAAFIKKIWS